MDTLNWLEIFGYIASVTTAISLMMSSVLRLRWINMIGSILFTIYGLLIGAMPVAALNFFIVGVNIWFLWRMYTEKQHFSLLETSTDDLLLNEFIQANKAEISKFFPQFSIRNEIDLIVVIHRDFSLAGVLAATREGSDSLRIEIDYVQSRFRDLMPGKFLFHDKRSFFTEKGIKRLISSVSHPAHADYLKRIGFQQQGDEFVLLLSEQKN